MCDHAGILKVDFGEFLDDLGVEEFDIKEFISSCNKDFDKENGNKVQRERIKLVKNNVFWITGFMKFQYENKELKLNGNVAVIGSALDILNGYGLIREGENKGYLTLTNPYEPFKRVKNP